MTSPIVQTDAAGVPRFLSFAAPESDAGLRSQAPQTVAHNFLQQRGDLLALAPATLKALDQPLANLPDSELAGLRVSGDKRLMDSITVAYAQTYFGLPVIGAGVAVTLRDEPLGVMAATSTVRHDISVARPSDADIKRALVLVQRQAGAQLAAAEVGLADTQDGATTTVAPPATATCVSTPHVLWFSGSKRPSARVTVIRTSRATARRRRCPALRCRHCPTESPTAAITSPSSFTSPSPRRPGAGSTG
ncbi:MAG: hypothetical protein IPG93_09565 [Burkholderiales bacterium]|nr:hypothetical protein [Burkholderiales bacterium]